MKKFATVLTVAILSMSTGKIWADGIGLTVSGVLTLFNPGDVPLQPSGVNFLDSGTGAVPPGYGNSNTNGTAVIGSGIEFGVSNGSDLLTMDYSNLDGYLPQLWLWQHVLHSRLLQSVYNWIFARFLHRSQCFILIRRHALFFPQC